MGLWSTFKNLFKKKRILEGNFLDETGKLIKKNVKYDNNTFNQKFNGEDHAYVIDQNFVIQDAKTGKAIAFYYINNPQPIRLQHERNKEVDSIGFRKIIDSKVIKDLFSDERAKDTLILLILIIATLGVSLFTLAKVMNWIK